MLGRNLLDAEVAVGRAEYREERDLRRELRGDEFDFVRARAEEDDAGGRRE